MKFDTRNVAEDVINHARHLGLDADVIVLSTEGVSVKYRMLSLEEEIVSTGCQVMLRVMHGRKQAMVSSNNLENLSGLVERAELMVINATEDLHACMPPIEFLARNPLKTDLYDSTVLSVYEMRSRAEALEGYALACPGISNSDGASFSYSVFDRAFASTMGQCVSYKKSAFNCSVCVVARSDKDGSMENWYDYSAVLRAKDLVDPNIMALQVAEMAVKLLNPVKVPSVRAEVVFAPREAASFLTELATLFSGTAIYNNASFLCGLLGHKLFSDNLTIIDDNTADHCYTSAPFDGEGVSSKKTFLVNGGVVTDWLMDSYTANKLGLHTNGKCTRTASGLSPSFTNLYLEPGLSSERDIIAGIKNGFYVVSTMGMGINYVTGDYSKGAQGFWIENGNISYPVSEVTIAGSLRDMLKAVIPASNLEFLHIVNAPTLYLGEMMVAGK